VNVNDLDFFSDSSRGVDMATDFMTRFGYMRSLGRAAFENGLQYRNYDLKILNDNILATFYINTMKIGPALGDYEGNKWTFLDEMAKIGLPHQISHQLLDRSSPTLQHW